MTEFRTITAVVQIDNHSELRYPGFALEHADTVLRSAGFVVTRIRNEPNETGELPERDR